MKKLMILVLALSMAVGFAGTAMAQTTVELNFNDTASGVSRVYWSPVFGTATGGASAFVVGGSILNETADGIFTGTTLYAVSNTLSNTAGTELRTQSVLFASGATPIGGPQLISGTSDTVVAYVQAPSTQTVGDGTSNSGNTLYIINGGTGANIYEIGLVGSALAAASDGPGSIKSNADTGLTPYSTAPVTIDTETVATSAGATIYGVSGATNTEATTGAAGVSVWAISAQTGTFATYAGLADAGLTAFVAGGESGVSAVHAAPVISGNSLFIIGYASAYNGNTIFQFDKRNLKAGVSNESTVNIVSADASDQWVPTPTVSGGSIFVVDNNGAVSAFTTANLSLQYSVDYAGTSDSGVTAGPVTDGTTIVLCSTASVTGFNLNTLSGNSKEWAYDFGANKSIWATPVISGSGTTNYVWITVNDTVAQAATTYRFTLNDTFNGDPQIVRTHGKLVYASPIVVDTNLWTVTYNPTVEKLTATGASGVTYWPQFKFDKGKTGANLFTASTTEAEAATAVPGSSGGCFISTIK